MDQPLNHITIFKNILMTNTPFFRDIDFALNRIKNGVSKDLVLSIRKEKDKEKSQKLKAQLPAILFSGTFSARNSKSLIQHSGFICLDFDKYATKDLMLADRKKLENDQYTYALFTSPSGNGMKVLVKITPYPHLHKKLFQALEQHYKIDNFDTSTSDVCRVCYESYDPHLFINKSSKVWDKIDTEELGISYNHVMPEIVIQDEQEKIDILVKWFEKKYSMNDNRNSSIFVLAAKFNQFGISKRSCINYSNKYIREDFTEREIERTISSAYQNTAEAGTKFFEDTKTIKKIKDEAQRGVSLNDIKEKFPSLNVDNIVNDVVTDIFWFRGANNRIGIDNFKYKSWLEQSGFYKYYPEGSESFLLIRLENNVIDTTTEVKIKDYILAYLLKVKEYDVYQFITNNPKYFKDDYLNTIEVLDIKFKEDTPHAAYLYFKSNVVEVTKDNVNIIDYIDLDGFVWKKQIINHEFKDVEYSNSIFYKFIEKVSNSEEPRFDSIVSVLGYLMHSYKTSANNRAIIINDETISDNPNGGSGKGIFCNALKYVKKVDFIDGKSFNFEKNFAYQTLNADTQVLVFDDVQNKFNFESLFSVITEGITIEKKNKDAIKIPVSRSPKIVITTNYTIGGSGGSHERRKFEVEFSAYFNANHTPEQEFGGLLFDSWDEAQWDYFYSFMIKSIQFFLLNGLRKYEHKNLELRKLHKDTSPEFLEFMEEQNIVLGSQYSKTDLFNRFIAEYPDFSKWLKQKRFKMWLDNYAQYLKQPIEHFNLGGTRWVIIGTAQTE